MPVNVSYEEALRRGWIQPDAVPKRALSRRSNAEREGEEQASLLKAFRTAFPRQGALLIHIPNGGSRKNAFEGWRMKQQGVRPGVSDLFLPVARGGFFGCWIEFKAAPPFDAKVSEVQLEWIELMKAEGYYATVCKGEAEAFQTLVGYMAMPPTQPVFQNNS